VSEVDNKLAREKEEYMDEIVQIPVPKKYLPDVYALLARLMNEGQATPPEAVQALPVEVTEANGWTAEKLRRAWDESPAPIRKILSLLANHPDEVFTAEQLQQTLEDKELGGTIGSFGRRVRNRYRMKSLPFEFYWNYETKRREYKMPASVAEKIRSFL
jgi:hypothetical protein